MLSFQVRSMLMWKVQYKAMGGGGKKIPLLALFLAGFSEALDFFFPWM